MENQKKTFETNQITLAALILSEIPGCNFSIEPQVNTIYKTIKITYPFCQEGRVNILFSKYVEKRAQINLYFYIRSLRQLREALNEHAKKN